MKERSTGNTVLVIDKLGRGSALVDKYGQSEHVGQILAVPGNDLMQENTEKPVQIYPELTTTSIKEIEEICEKERVDLVDIADDRAVEAGIANTLRKRGISVVGPSREAGRIEWDKAFAREFGFKLGLPQPNFTIRTKEELDSALTLMDIEPNKQRFIKASFLADGKGAKPARDREEAKAKILEIAKTEAGKVFLIEDWLVEDDLTSGKEFSLFVVSDGENYRVLGNAQDYKRENNFDEGENTGSMGCNSPTLLMTPQLLRDAKKEIIEKVIKALKEKGTPYQGVLYLGGMAINKANKVYASYLEDYDLKPYVIEFNARWGDPEAEAILPGLKVDLFELGKAVSDGDISKIRIGHDNKVRLVLTGAAKGYPREEEYRRVSGQIFGLDKVRQLDGIKVYGAGIKKIDGKYYARARGRLFFIVAEGDNILEARAKALQAMALICIAGNNLKYRNDIGIKDAERFYRSNNKPYQYKDLEDYVNKSLSLK